MAQLDDVIQYESEHTALDFKRTQYAREQHSDLLKDVLSMANAHAMGDRHIVCGVAPAPGGNHILGVPSSQIVDAAIYQQLVHENVEPDIDIEYFAYEIGGAAVGILRIPRCTERPYAMRKDFGTSLRRGDMWIRKGTHQMRITREDLERIYAERQQATGFAGEVQLSFDAPDDPTIISLPAVGAIDLASDRASRKIRAILHDRRMREEFGIRDPRMFNFSIASISGLGTTPYEDRSTEVLERDLREIKETYEDDDLYERYELNSHKLDLVLFNESTEHLENARLDIEIPATHGVLIADREYAKPYYGPGGYNMAIGPFYRPGEPSYPDVTLEDGVTRIAAEIGDLRHRLRTKAFGVPVRLVLGPEAIGHEVSLECTLRGKNLRTPITSRLVIEVTPPDSSFLLAEGESGV